MEGYFDESGSFEEPPHIFCLAGYIVCSAQAKVMDAAWGEVLQEYKLPYFHMVDCAHGNKPFNNLEKEERSAIAKKMIELIKAHTIEGWAVIAKREQFRTSESNPDPYSALVQLCIIALNSFMQGQRIDGPVAYIFETGHKNKGNAYNHVGHMVRSIPGASFTFAAKQSAHILQAADILAWQTTKFVKDDATKKRPRRKDFTSLLEHKHTLMYLDQRQDSLDMLRVEMWPPERWPQSNTALFYGNHGSAVIMEDGKTIPVIHVERTEGITSGSFDLAFASFKGYDKKDYNLGFDGRRLSEAVSVLLDVMKHFPDSVQSEPIIDIQAMFLLIRERDMLFRMQMANGRHISFRVPDSKRQAIMAGYGIDPARLSAALERGQIQILQVF
jgi:Protein of unknown function (DUF3800)